VNNQNEKTSAGTVEAELAVLDGEIEGMEAEVKDAGAAPLVWDRITSTTADELVAKEQRRSILPRLITAARIHRLELERRREVERVQPLEEEGARAHERLEKATAAKSKAEEEAGYARFEWNNALSRLENRHRHIKEIDRAIADLKGGA
jgi:multidrug resistance efflux pump